ncbi:MAG: nitroreductase family deazaflavin-dependent oxidoreductase [Proteobacteria bacterium]|nr:nitroreductase family deazaflavin-dependent oxidoreductase [Pseudomonadota bacterium]
MFWPGSVGARKRYRGSVKIPRPPGLDAIHSQFIVKWMSQAQVWLYRQSDGRFGNRFRGRPVVLLTVTGRKSGEPRTKPLLYLRDGPDVVVVASSGGMAKHPQWYRNLIADPACRTLIDGADEARRARTATPDEKARLWPLLNELYSDFELYQEWAGDSREIPVVILEPG